MAMVANNNTPPPAPRLAVMAEVRQEKKIKNTVVALEMEAGHSQSNIVFSLGVGLIRACVNGGLASKNAIGNCF